MAYTPALNATHDPALTSWVVSANAAECEFPIQNLPFASFRRRKSQEPFRIGVAIGEFALDLSSIEAPTWASAAAASALAAARAARLNTLMDQGRGASSALRALLSRLLTSGTDQENVLKHALIPLSDIEYALPANIGDYTDFYTSIHHATAVGRLFRPDNPLLPNYRHLPIGYHGRSSSIGVSGQVVNRPFGQTLPAGAEVPIFGPTQRLDYEVELGWFIGQGNRRGTPIPIEEAEAHLFGLCILNDWSARDIQAWEYQPLGPFLSKSFATTISPWVVTLEALEPYRVETLRSTDTPLMAYLDHLDADFLGGFDVQLQTSLVTTEMRTSGLPSAVLSRSSYRHAYWTAAQLVAHHSVNGCNLCPGDLLGTGTQSGPRPEEAGSLIELTQAGRSPFKLPNGQQRRFLEDGDEVIISAWCQSPGGVRIGFGEVRGRIG